MLPPFLSPFDFLLRCTVSMVLGAMIGLEREYKNKPAGIKTHTLICMGSAALTYLSFHFSPHGDPGRIAAQIVSGIGFIGGGTILQSKRMVKGLTTAASLWVVASVGMLVGAGFFLAGFLLAAVVTSVLVYFRPFSTAERLRKLYYVTIEINKIDAIERIGNLIKKFQLAAGRRSIIKKKRIYVELNYMATPVAHHLFIRRLFKIKGVTSVVSI